MHTPSSTARTAGIAKSTIYSAIKAGRLSAHKLQSGKYAIYLSELRRASPQPRRYPKLRNAVASAFQCGMWADVAEKVPPRTARLSPARWFVSFAPRIGELR
jgi:hypothetical protein